MKVKKEVLTGCRVDCPDACSLIATFRNGRWTIRGNPDHPITQGVCCHKVHYFLKRHFSPSRLTNPMIKKQGEWKTISINEALEICAEKMDSLLNTPERILHIQGHGIRGIYVDSVRYFFASIGASKTRGSLCDDAGIEASILDFGTLDHNEITDVENSDYIVNWGRDVNRSSIHLALFLRRARKRGATVITISPGGCDLSGVCDEHILIKPGTDRFLVVAILKEIFERYPELLNRIWECPGGKEFHGIIERYEQEYLLDAAQVSLSDVKKLADIYLSSHRVSTIIGWGLQRHIHGGETVRWINALAYLTGHVGRIGEGIYFNVSSRRHFSYEGVTYPLGYEKPRRELCLPRIGREILDSEPPVEMVWINGTNIVNQAPSSRVVAKALERVPFVVVVDAFMTDTAKCADLFLPVSLMWEEEDIVGSAMHNFVNYCGAFLNRPDNVLSDREWINGVNELISRPVELPSRDRCYELAFSSPVLSHVSLDELKKKGFVRAEHSELAMPEGFTHHPHGRISLIDKLSPPFGKNTDFPLHLLTLVRRNYLHSQILPEDHKSPVVYISEDNPFADTFDNNSKARITTPKGSLVVSVKKLPPGCMHPEVVIYRRDDWASLDGGINQIIEDFVTDIGETGAYYSQCARLEAIK